MGNSMLHNFKHNELDRMYAVYQRKKFFTKVGTLHLRLSHSFPDYKNFHLQVAIVWAETVPDRLSSKVDLHCIDSYTHAQVLKSASLKGNRCALGKGWPRGDSPSTTQGSRNRKWHEEHRRWP